MTYLLDIIFILIFPILTRKVFSSRAIKEPFVQAFFLGIAYISIFLQIFSILNFPFQFTARIFITVIIVITIFKLCISQEKDSYRIELFNKEPLKKWLSLSLLIAVFYYIQISIFSSPFFIKPEASHWSFIGSQHTMAYTNLVDEILKNDRVPILKQHYLQSILTAFFSYFPSESSPVERLFFLNIIGKASITLLLIEFLSQLTKFSKAKAIFVTILSLGFTINLFQFQNQGYLRIIDSGYPLQHVGYFDTISGIAYFLILARVLFMIKDKQHQTIFLDLPILFYSFSLCAFQNFMFVPFLILSTYYKNKHIKKNLKVIVAILGSSIVLIYGLGGVGTNPIKVDQISWDGKRAIPEVRGVKVKLFGPPYLVDTNTGRIRENLSYDKNKKMMTKFIEFVSIYSIIVISLILIAWKPPMNKINSFLLALIILSGPLFVTFFEVRGLRWELTRFLYIPLLAAGLATYSITFNAINGISHINFLKKLS